VSFILFSNSTLLNFNFKDHEDDNVLVSTYGGYMGNQDQMLVVFNRHQEVTDTVYDEKVAKIAKEIKFPFAKFKVNQTNCKYEKLLYFNNDTYGN
jgi:hypothetical protein